MDSQNLNFTTCGNKLWIYRGVVWGICLLNTFLLGQHLYVIYKYYMVVVDVRSDYYVRYSIREKAQRQKHLLQVQFSFLVRINRRCVTILCQTTVITSNEEYDVSFKQVATPQADFEAKD